jgi:DNA repair protein RecO (recombination protein O)
MALLDMIGTTEVWPLAYLRWEMALLEEMGFALDLSVCAATGAADDLIYVSPRTGRAVSRAGAGDWADRLLPLSPAMTGTATYVLADVVTGLGTTGFFLADKLAPALGHRPLPEARQRLLDALDRRS